MKEHNILISSSKDTYVKFWDLDTEHNFKTLVGHRSEVSYSIIALYFLVILFLLVKQILINDFIQVWSLALVKDDKYLIIGCDDAELRVWKIIFVNNKNIEFNNATNNIDLNEESIDTDMVCIYICIYHVKNCTKFTMQVVFI